MRAELFLETAGTRRHYTNITYTPCALHVVTLIAIAELKMLGTFRIPSYMLVPCVLGLCTSVESKAIGEIGP
jgi:hypothetical protein